MTPNTIEFRAHENTWVMRITAEKRIEVNEGVDVTEAAQKVLAAMQTLLDRAYGTQEPTACLIDGKLMAYGNKPLPQEGLLYLHMQPDDDGHCKACDGKYCTARKGCVALDNPPPKKPWAGLMRGVRVEGDHVVISVHYGNDAARQLCAALIQEMNT